MAAMYGRDDEVASVHTRGVAGKLVADGRWLMADVQVRECVLAPGEILFLPVGGWHAVEALDMSMTVTFANFKWITIFTASIR
ncbi:JmjC domain-containing protein [Janthinobacterium sp. HLX7-2]|uniref:JmjC domain-containing protein n=1 Tax=Janthinobacterium sp. HLX7-2 TaxID=1259331 RepID=UPI003F1ED947